MDESEEVGESSVPREIMMEVLKEFPVKSLLRFRCVSKLWCSIIDDPIFIESHQTRSETRPGGMNTLLVLVYMEYPNRSYHLYPVSAEGGPDTHLLALPLEDLCSPLQHVHGLVYLADRILNPSTREIIQVLPPVSVTCETPSGNNLWNFCSQHFFGFDPSTKKYKILNICQYYMPTSPLVFRVQYKILTLGTNSWRDIDSVPNHELKGFAMDGSCCMRGVIYIPFNIQFSNHNQHVILAFEVGDEKFRIIHLPEGATQISYTVQVGENLAIIDSTTPILWILEDYDNHMWKKLHDIVLKGIALVGTVHTGEIVLYNGASTLTYFDPVRRQVRHSDLSNLPADSWSCFRFTKYAESLFRLKSIAKH